MTLAKRSIVGSIGLLVLLLYPQNVWAEGFKNKDFLTMQPEQQKFWLHGAIESLGHVAALKKQELGKCVYDWYFGDQIAKRNALILASIEKYPEHTPTTILLALTERACGKYLGIE